MPLWLKIVEGLFVLSLFVLLANQVVKIVPLSLVRGLELNRGPKREARQAESARRHKESKKKYRPSGALLDASVERFINVVLGVLLAALVLGWLHR